MPTPGHWVARAARKNHPRIKKRLSIEHPKTERHVVVHLVQAELERPSVSQLYRENDIILRPVASSPSIAMCLLLVAQIDYICAVPKNIARQFEDSQKLTIHSSPQPTFPSIAIRLAWHDRTHRSHAQKWFRERLHASAL